MAAASVPYFNVAPSIRLRRSVYPLSLFLFLIRWRPVEKRKGKVAADGRRSRRNRVLHGTAEEPMGVGAMEQDSEAKLRSTDGQRTDEMELIESSSGGRAVVVARPRYRIINPAKSTSHRATLATLAPAEPNDSSSDRRR